MAYNIGKRVYGSVYGAMTPRKPAAKSAAPAPGVRGPLPNAPMIQPGETPAQFFARVNGGGGRFQLNGNQGYSYAPPGTPGTSAAGSGGDPSRQLPVDPIYDSTIGGLTRRRDYGIADLGDRQTNLLSDAGYTATFDDKGDVTGLAFDPNNPNSRAALLKRTYEANKRGTTNSMAARGQLFSGALINAQGENDFRYQHDEDAIRKALGRGLGEIGRSKRDLQSDFETGSGTAYGERLGRLPQNPAYDPAAAAAAAKPKPKVKKKGKKK